MLTTAGATRLAARTIAVFRSWLSRAEEFCGLTWVVGATEGAGWTVDNEGANSSSSGASAAGLHAAQRLAVSRMHHDWLGRSRNCFQSYTRGLQSEIGTKGFPVLQECLEPLIRQGMPTELPEDLGWDRTAIRT